MTQNPYGDRFGFSSPDTRNMDTLIRQAKGLRKRAAGDPEYVEFVAKNLERIAEEYAEVFKKMHSARAELTSIKEMINNFFEEGK